MQHCFPLVLAYKRQMPAAVRCRGLLTHALYIIYDILEHVTKLLAPISGTKYNSFEHARTVTATKTARQTAARQTKLAPMPCGRGIRRLREQGVRTLSRKQRHFREPSKAPSAHSPRGACACVRFFLLYSVAL